MLSAGGRGRDFFLGNEGEALTGGFGLNTPTPEEQGLTYDPNFVPDPNRIGSTYMGYKEANGPTLTRESLGLPATFGGGGGRIVSGGGGGGGGGGGLVGAPPRDYDPTHGGVPGVSNPIDVILGNMGGITGIQTGLTDNALQLLRNQYGPGYFATLEQLRRNTDRRAHGDISDLIPELWQTNAENAVGGGYSGSAQENTKRLRDLGLTRYGVENEATNSLAKIFGMTPTVNPQDMSGIISALVQAQMMADIYRSSPNPSAYARSLPSGGGGGGFGGGVRYGASGGGGASKVDDILKRMGGNAFGPPIIAHGTKQPDYTSSGPTWGNFYDSPGLTDLDRPIRDDAPAGMIDWGTDFGGSLNYGGGAAWESPFGYTPPTGFGGSQDYDPGGFYGPMFDPFDTSGWGGGGGAPAPVIDSGNDWGMDPLGGSMGDAGPYDFPWI